MWLHGDLHPANLLIEDGRLSAVIDFGDLTAGDPATDLAVAWMLLPPAVRERFRVAARGPSESIDDATWLRASGWALHLGLAFAANAHGSEKLGALGLRTIAAVLTDGGLPLRSG